MTSDSSMLIPGKQIKANLDKKYARYIVKQRYGFNVNSIFELNAYDDQNFHVLCEDEVHISNPYVTSIAKDGYVLKIINSLDSRKTDFIEAQNKLLIFLDKMGFMCPIPVRQMDGSYYSMEILDKNGLRHILRLLVYRPGEILNKVHVSIELLKQIGLYIARLDKAMEGFSHPAYEYKTSLWVLSATPKLRDFLFVIDDKKNVIFIEEIIIAFEKRVLTITNSLDKGILHGDLNEDNIIVSPDGKNVKAVIDFGDSHKSCFVFELAICLCYMITWTNNINLAKYVIEGYLMIRQLTKQEKEILKLCVCARFVQSLVLGTYSYQREPTNQYLIRDHETKWSLLKKLWSMNDIEVIDIWGIKN